MAMRDCQKYEMNMLAANAGYNYAIFYGKVLLLGYNSPTYVVLAGTRYHTEKLRKYQLSRLKYYYAVVECDSTATASTIYDDCDGMEYETSSTKLDLRYIPDDMEFDQAATSECTEMPHGFKPILFANTALSQCKVDLTWDETDQERVQSTAQVWASRDKDVPEDDLKAYLASSSDDEGPDYGSLLDVSEDGASDSGGEGDEERQIARYRSLLQDIDTSGGSKSKPRDVEMEITWEPGLKETTEGIIRKKKNSKDLTPWEEYLQRKKEKKKKKRSERKKKVDEYEDVEETEQPDDGNAAFSDDELPAGVDVNDPLFTDELKTLDNGKKEKKKKKKDKKKDVNENTQEQAELSLLMMDEEEDKRHFNLKDLVEDSTKHKKKKKKQQEDSKDNDNFQVNVADPRFAAMFDSHHYNIDPSAPEYKKTKGTEAIITEKLKRRRDKGKKEKYVSSSDNIVKDKKRKTESDGDMSQAPVMKDNSLAMLVKSVKVKTHQFQSNKKR